MLNNYRPVRASLYVLLFLSFVAMSVAKPVASWISTTFGGWVTVEAMAGYGVYVVGLIWLINRVNKAAGMEPPAASSGSSWMMSEADFIRSYAQTAEHAQARPAEDPEPERRSEVEIKS